MPKNVLQLIKYYKSDATLLNSMAKSASGDFRTIACYLGGVNDGNNIMHEVADKVIYCGISKRRLYWSNIFTVNKLTKIIDENDIDLVVCQFRRTIPIGAMATIFSKRKPKIIGVLHGVVGGGNSLTRKLINYFAYHRLSKIVSVSEFGIKDIYDANIGLGPDKVTAVPNGIQCDRFINTQNIERSQHLPEFNADDFIFFMAGRMSPKKNHIPVLHAFAKLAGKYPQAKLAIAGTGPIEGQLRTFIQELGLEQQVKMLGFRKDIAELLNCTDVFLMPSLREGLPLALMEAMVSGLPVITSNVIGMQELVPDETFGYPVDPTSVESLVNGLTRSITDTELDRDNKRKNAKDRILSHYTEEIMISNYEQLYRELLNAPQERELIYPQREGISASRPTVSTQ